MLMIMAKYVQFYLFRIVNAYRGLFQVSVSKESFTTASRIVRNFVSLTCCLNRTSSQNCPEEYQWNVVEVNPTLLPDPKKKDDPRYRVRTLNGEALYAESDSKLAIGERVEGAQRHVRPLSYCERRIVLMAPSGLLLIKEMDDVPYKTLRIRNTLPPTEIIVAGSQILAATLPFGI